MLRDKLVFDERLHAVQSQLRVTDRGLLAGHVRAGSSQIRSCLVHRMDVVRVVNLDEQLVGLDEIALVHVELGDIPVHARKQIHLLIGGDVGREGEPDIQVLLDRRDGADGDDAPLAGIAFGPAAAQAKHHKTDQHQDQACGEHQDHMLSEAIHPGVSLCFLAPDG